MIQIPLIKKKLMARIKKAKMADLADRHVLYQQSVQCVEAEIDFVDEIYTEYRGKAAKLLREDFCGTGNTACEWVRRRKDNCAYGVDLDTEVLDWGQKNNVGKLRGKAKDRIELIEADVLKVKTDPMDIVLAMNFSYWLFMDRKTMKEYFKSVRNSLVEDGIFFLDAFGGYEAPKVLRERTDHEDFTYIWHQAEFNPINHKMSCYLHFKFPDGSRLNKAFTYTWRLWSLPEIRELLEEAGFSKSTIYMQGYDEETGEGSGEFEATEVGEPEAGWLCYIVAEK